MSCSTRLARGLVLSLPLWPWDRHFKEMISMFFSNLEVRFSSHEGKKCWDKPGDPSKEFSETSLLLQAKPARQTAASSGIHPCREDERLISPSSGDRSRCSCTSWANAHVYRGLGKDPGSLGRRLSTGAGCWPQNCILIIYLFIQGTDQSFRFCF